jgi:anti-anti-sigma regulatory factor
MGIARKQCSEGNRVQLEGTVDIASALELKTHLVEALKLGQEVRIDLSAATYLDVTALQLLCAAVREAKTRGVGCICEGGIPQAIRSSLREAGFEELLALAKTDAAPGELK